MNEKLFVLIMVVLLGGCAGMPVRTGQRFVNYFRGPEKTVAVVPIDIKFLQISAGGVVEQMDEWDAKSDDLFEKAITKKLDPLGHIKIRIIRKEDIPAELKSFLDEEGGLYRAVAQSIILHTYTEGNIFQHKIDNFDYTLGEELSGLNNYYPADAIMFVSGSSSYSTGGRIFLTALGILAGAAAGVYVMPAGLPDWVAVSLVDCKSGDIIWFKFLGGMGDLRGEKGVYNAVEYLFSDLCVPGKL
jgi:hypothetical protein